MGSWSLISPPASHPDSGLLSPAAIVDIAEQGGLIGALGQRVPETTCADAVEWLADMITSILETTGLPATNLWLEITESALLTSLNASTPQTDPSPFGA